MLQIEREGKFRIYLAANDGINVTTPEQLTEWNDKRYDTFDELKSERDNFLKIKFCNSKQDWNTSSTCSCRSFQKEFMCKHILALAFFYKLKKCPQEGFNKLISQKPKKGRIPRAKKALVKQ